MTRSDIPTVGDLIRCAEAFDGIPRIVQDDELEEEFDDETVVLATDTRLAEIDGVPVGHAHTMYLPADAADQRCYIFGNVDPAHRGRGIGRALMTWAVERGTEQLRSSGTDLPKRLRVESYDFLDANHRLYERMGFATVRYFEELLRPLADPPPPPTIDGVHIVEWPDDRDEEIRVEKNLSFADHWGSTPTSPERWNTNVRGLGGRPEWSFVAVDDSGDVIGHCLNHRYEADDELLGRRDGWIQSLGTLPEWRGRGTASALVAHSLRRFADEGLTHASLGVDSDSPTGAARLYRGLGFELSQRLITRQITIE
jgi:mycothiol synthase